jgi:SAM-dependent methyltransferase
MLKLETEYDSYQWINAAKALAVVSAWNGLGLFERMRGGPVLRSELPADARAIDTTLPVLQHVGLVALDGARVGLTERARRLLETREMPSDRNLVALRELGRMADVLRHGGPVKDDEGQPKATMGGTIAGDVAATERFLDMLYRISEEPAKSTFTWLAPGLPAKGAVLDLGGGHGRYARAFADAGHDVTLFDQEAVVGLAKKRHGESLRYLAGDFHKVDTFGGPYDLILMCNIVHGEATEANGSIVTRAAKSLRPGGRLVIRDMFLDEHGGNPGSAAFFGITMLYYTLHGRSPSIPEARGWFKDAGLTFGGLVVLETHQMVIGERK